MSKYTTELRYICEVEAGLEESVGYNEVENVIANSRERIFNFDYPIFDEAYRSVLETKILKHYYTREIGAEVYGLWKLWLNRKMNEIMPYYNQMYKSELLEFNPLYDFDVTRDHKFTRNEQKEETGESTGKTVSGLEKTGNVSNSESGSGSDVFKGKRDNSETSTGSSNNRTTSEGMTNSMDAFSNTPQGTLENVKTLTYLTEAREITGGDNRTGEEIATVSNSNEGVVNTDNTRTTNNSKESSNEYEENIDNTIDVTSNNSGTTVLNNTEDYLEHVKGKNGGASYSKLLKEFRTTFLNIDMLVIDELSDLFITLW